jgi:hypothetical protein
MSWCDSSRPLPCIPIVSRVKGDVGVGIAFGEDECRRYHALLARFRRKEAHELSSTPRPS